MGNQDRRPPHDPGFAPHLYLWPERKHLGPRALSYREARLELQEAGHGANGAQLILEDLAHWGPGVRSWSYKRPGWALAWLTFAGGRPVEGEHWQQPYYFSNHSGPAPCQHTWVKCEVGCDDCGSHDGLACEECGLVIDLVRDDDPRESYEPGGVQDQD